MVKLLETLQIKAKKLIILATWVLIVMLLASTIKNLTRVGAIRKEVQKEAEKVAKMQEENARLEAEIARVQSNDFIEKQIRDKLGLAKTGEAIVVLPDADILKKLAPQMQTEEDTLPDPNWKKWEKLFF